MALILDTNILDGTLLGQPTKIYLIHNVTKLKLQFQVLKGRDLEDEEGFIHVCCFPYPDSALCLHVS
jgi:hypothetical protein